MTSPPAAELSPEGAIGSSPAETSGLVLAPRPWVPLGVIGLGALPLIAAPQESWALAVAAALGLFGLFLLLQTLLLRLQFSDKALLVWRRNTVLRRFPYTEWISWRLFWKPLPVLFYFRERNSLHLLPVLFDANALRQQLERHLSALP